VIGTRETVGGIDAAQLRAFHDERYTPASVVIAAAGSLEHEAIVRMASESRPPAGGPNGAVSSAPSAPGFERAARFQRKDTEQYHVCIGGPGIARADDRRFALRVLEGVLGGTPSSRLFQEVRERRGLAYSVFSFSNFYATTGEVGIYVGTRPENLCEALAVIAAELARITHDPDPFAEEELVRSRECSKSALVLALESSGARMGRLGSSLLFDLPILSPEELMERIDAASAQQCAALARELFVGERLSVAGIGPDEDLFRKALLPLEELAGAASGSSTAAEPQPVR